MGFVSDNPDYKHILLIKTAPSRNERELPDYKYKELKELELLSA
jgi:hypothetical protein